jgi:tetratricopeptide (TPR) repeat protein
VTPRSDLYAAAVVVYEALTGRQLEAPKPVDEVDWHGVPHSLVPILRRGLAWSPDARWPDAAPFRHALWDTRKQPYRQRTVALTAAGVLVGGAIIFTLDLLATRPGPPLLAIEPFTVTEPTLPLSLGDSLACLVARDLSGNPDFVARCPGGRSDGPPDAAVRGTVTSMEDSICVEVRVEGLVRVSQQLAAGACAPSGALNELAQRAGVLVLYEIWKSQDAIIRDVPRQHLPRDPRAVTAFLEGERAFSRARWGEALAAYGEAEAIDSTCRLCSWRVYDAQRWHGLPHDLRHIARFVQAAGSFPPHYQSLLRAPGLPLAARLDTLVDAAKRHFRSPLIWWSLGEELFHRGPIVGRERRDAIDAFQQAVALRSDFGPAWEHLAWAYTAEGDSAGADSALAHWRATMRGDPSDTFTLGLRSLLETGFAWRFFDTAQAVRRTRAALAEPAIAASADLIVAPRFLPTFDALPGAVWLGRLFASDRRSHFQSAGLLAMGLAFSALGRPDSAEARLGELVARFPDEELQLFVVQYPAALAAIDPVPFGDRRTALRTALTRLAAPGSAEPIRHRAAATLSVLTLLDSEPAESPPHLPPGDLTPAQRALLGAVRAGREGRWVVALARTEAIRRDSAAHVSDPTLRAITRLLRAEWLDSMGNVDAARRELRWADHSWTIYWPVGPPQAAEVDWSLRTLARWRRARLLDRAGVRDRELCASYVHVARDWAAGMPVYAARADTARQRHHAVGCPTLR